MRITVNNKRSDISISRKVDPRKWSSKSEKALGKSPKAIELNNYINVLKNRIKKIHQDLIEKDKTVSAKSIIDEFKGVNKKQPKMTLEVFKEHNEKWTAFSEKVFLRASQSFIRLATIMLNNSSTMNLRVTTTL